MITITKSKTPETASRNMPNSKTLNEFSRLSMSRQVAGDTLKQRIEELLKVCHGQLCWIHQSIFIG